MLPNVQVDGTLNIEGEVFIPAGATFSKVVETEGNQTIAGVKTFSSSPIVPTPTTGTQAVNKDYADLKVALTDFTGTNLSLSGNGYQKLPSGLIIQWGTTSFTFTGASTNYADVTFPIAFPNNIVAITTGQVTSNPSIFNESINSGTTTGFRYYQSSTGGSGTLSNRWIAIGY